MPLSDIPISVLVALFLAVFVLIGIHPALRKFAQRIRKLAQSGARPTNFVATLLEDAHDEMFAHPDSQQLNDFEIIVLRRIAQAGGKALSRKQVNEPLLLGTTVLQKTLRSLLHRGMLQVNISTLLGPRFALSAEGRRYAIEQGYIVIIKERKRALG